MIDYKRRQKRIGCKEEKKDIERMFGRERRKTHVTLVPFFSLFS